MSLSRIFDILSIVGRDTQLCSVLIYGGTGYTTRRVKNAIFGMVFFPHLLGTALNMYVTRS